MNEVSFSRAVKEVKFGAWTLDPKRQTISDGEVTRELEPLLFKILCYLIINDEQIITRQDLIDDVWCQNYVDDNAINRAMSELRKVLKSDKQKGLVVKTHYRKGYSFFLKAEIVYLDIASSGVPTQPSSTPTSHSTASLSTGKSSNSSKLILYASGLVVAFSMVLFIGYHYLTVDDSLTPEQAKLVVESKRYNEELLSWVPGQYLSMSLSPNKNLISYLFIPKGKSKATLVIKNLSSSLEKKIGFQGADVYPLGWSYDSSKMFYKMQREGECEVWQVDANLESNNRYLFSCQETINIGAGIDDEHFVYSKLNYRGKDNLSALISVNINTGEEFQLTSPNLNSRGDILLLYEPSLNKIFFQRWQVNSVELYMTDLEGSNQEKLYESSSQFLSLSYIPSDNTLAWFNNQTNTVSQYSLTEKRHYKDTQIDSKSIFALSQIVSLDEIIVTSYPFSYSVYDYDVNTKAVSPFIKDKGVIMQGVNGKDKTFILGYEQGSRFISYSYDNGKAFELQKRLKGEYKSIRYSFSQGQLLATKQDTIGLFTSELELQNEFKVNGSIISSEYLLNGDVGYVVFNDNQKDNDAFIYSKELKLSRKLPISNIVWFDQLDDDTYLMLSSKDKLQYFSISKGKVVNELALNFTKGKHTLAIGNKKVFYSDGSSIFDVTDGRMNKVVTMEGKSIYALSYCEKRNKLMFNTTGMTNNHMISLKPVIIQ